MVRFDARYFSVVVAKRLHEAERGARTRLETLVPRTSLQRLLGQGRELRVSHIITICEFFDLELEQYLLRDGARQRDYIIV